MYTRIRELLEQVLLEYDPKHSVFSLEKGVFSTKKGGEKVSRAGLARVRAARTTKSGVSKVADRALSRGGDSEMRTRQGKMRGPKGKLPEALEQALLEFDPRKEGFRGAKKHPENKITRQSAAATTVFLNDLERGDTSRRKAKDWSVKSSTSAFKSAKKSEKRQLARGGEGTPDRGLISNYQSAYNKKKRKLKGPKGKLPK